MSQEASFAALNQRKDISLEMPNMNHSKFGVSPAILIEIMQKTQSRQFSEEVDYIEKLEGIFILYSFCS